MTDATLGETAQESAEAFNALIASGAMLSSGGTSR
jgi:hypothetical protein